jgi:hypothetical protein
MDWAVDRANDLVAWAGFPLALLAWVTVSSAVVAMAMVLRRHGNIRSVLPATLVVTALAALGHGSDIVITFKMSPDLGMEENQMWLAIVRVMGWKLAVAYGITGQILVIILSGELYAWYRLVRARYWPAEASEGFFAFLRGYGANRRWLGVAWGPVGVLGAFMFAFLGPFFLYVAWLNSIVMDFARHDRMPQPLPVAFCWLAAVGVSFFVSNWRAAVRTGRGA